MSQTAGRGRDRGRRPGGDAGRRAARAGAAACEGCLAVLVALVVRGRRRLRRRHQGRAVVTDQLLLARGGLPRPRHGKVIFEVKPGDTIAGIGRDLKAKGVVASVDAFTDAANDNPDSTGSRSASTAEEADAGGRRARGAGRPGQHRKSTVTIPEGLGSTEIVALLAKKTDFAAAAVRAGARGPRRARPAVVRQGQPRGLPVPVDLRLRARRRRPPTMLTTMVDALAARPPTTPTWRPAAKQLGYTPGRADDGRQPGRGRGPRRPGHAARSPG